MTGKKFGRLTVIKNIGIIAKRTHWECLCECNNKITISTSRLINGHTKSCGCLRSELLILRKTKFSRRIASARRIWQSSYKKELPFEDFLVLSQQNCYYCGSKPNNINNVSKRKERKVSYSAEYDFIYNGLDRISSQGKHNVNNVFPCCKFCNSSKNNRSYDEFIKYIEDLYFNIKLQNLKEFKNNLIKYVNETFDDFYRPNTKTYKPIIYTAKCCWRSTYMDGCKFREFYHISQLNCYYCGAPPNNKSVSRIKKDSTIFIYSGLDRISSDLDHNIFNILPCCKFCNFSKSNRTYDEFLIWIDMIYHNLKNKLKINEAPL